VFPQVGTKLRPVVFGVHERNMMGK